MSTPGPLIRYSEPRALEDAAFAHGLAPTHIFALLLPVWRVEVQATITDAEDYALIDGTWNVASLRPGWTASAR
jgi:hypothetical protein